MDSFPSSGTAGITCIQRRRWTPQPGGTTRNGKTKRKPPATVTAREGENQNRDDQKKKEEGERLDGMYRGGGALFHREQLAE